MVLVASLFTAVNGSTKPVLRMRADGTFKVLQFTDLHFGEDSETECTWPFLICPHH